MNSLALPPEVAWIRAGALLLVLATVSAWLAASRACGGTHVGRLRVAGLAPRAVAPLFAAALFCVAGGIALRWMRIGHGPFLSMFEVLASSIASLGAIWAFACRRTPALRRTAPVVLPVLATMAAWLVLTSPVDTHLPPTYETPVLWFHVLLGKAFLGCALVALGLAGVILARGRPRVAAWFARMPGDEILDRLAWRFMQGALMFESFMLIAGAVWAQDAWGRYWAWDPLETWAFLTWLALAGGVHARLAWPLSPRTGALMIAAVFALAFLTFFGVPFIALAPHKGAV